MAPNEAVVVPPGLSTPKQEETSALWPGLLLCGGIAAVGVGLHQLPVIGVLSPMIIAVMIGMGLRNTVGLPEAVRAGISFALLRILRLAIILLGLQLTFKIAVSRISHFDPKPTFGVRATF